MIEWSNRVAYWVASDIVLTLDLKQRARVASSFIKIAHILVGKHNFNGAFEILSGLGMACVTRLKRTWALVKPKYKQMERELQHLTSADSNYKLLRAAIRGAKPPLIPYIGMYLTDLTFGRFIPV